MCAATLCLEKPSLESIITIPSHLIAQGLHPERAEGDKNAPPVSSGLNPVKRSVFPLKKLYWPSPTKTLALQTQLKKNILAPLAD
ncbi:MAG: hypothetical protein K2X66_15275 [Cyanobacteria bacterium]|nr:hypothetical protein [Cyanobacteriota bacterium]